jgi:hypothetical protein
MNHAKLKFGPLGMRFDDRYRTVPEAGIIQAIVLAGWVDEVDTGLATEASRISLQAWIALGLRFNRASNGGRLFDPIEVLNFMKRMGLDGRDGFLSERYTPTHHRLVLELGNVSSVDETVVGDRRFVVEFKRTFNLRSIPAGTQLRLRAPSPLPGQYLNDLQVTPFAETTGESETRLSPGRLELRLIASGEDEAALGAKWSFTARLQEQRSGDSEAGPDRALYLNEREGLVVVTNRVRELAQSLVRAGGPPFDVARAFWEYIHGELIFGAIHYDQIDFAAPCDWILDSGWFDCQLGGALFVALCRAHGICARTVSGYLLYRTAPVKHYWTEVWIDDRGWTPIDFIGWDLSQGGLFPKWRDRYFGRLDYRLICERMPREFTGGVGVPLPAAWFYHSIPKQGGVEGCFMAIEGTPIHRDLTRVTGWFTR